MWMAWNCASFWGESQVSFEKTWEAHTFLMKPRCVFCVDSRISLAEHSSFLVDYQNLLSTYSMPNIVWASCRPCWESLRKGSGFVPPPHQMNSLQLMCILPQVTDFFSSLLSFTSLLSLFPWPDSLHWLSWFGSPTPLYSHNREYLPKFRSCSTALSNHLLMIQEWVKFGTHHCLFFEKRQSKNCLSWFPSFS